MSENFSFKASFAFLWARSSRSFFAPLFGGYNEVKKELEAKMLEASENLQFERAKEFRDQMAHIESTMEKQKMMLNDMV